MNFSKTGGEDAPSGAGRKPRGENVDRIYAALRDDILELRRAPGEVLDEAEIAGTFGLSRLMRKRCCSA